jgi:hypothetical protein
MILTANVFNATVHGMPVGLPLVTSKVPKCQGHSTIFSGQDDFFRQRRFAMGTRIGRGIESSIDIVDGERAAVRHRCGPNFAVGKIRDYSDQDAICHDIRHNIVLPPLTLMTCPVTNDASFDAR